MSAVVDQLAQTDNTTVDEVLKHISEKLGTNSNSHLLQHELFNRIQMKNESFNANALELKRLSKQCDLGNQEDKISVRLEE